MIENPLISVIVPVYKVEEYLKKCIDSIINQTYKKLEIILVDDGSPDSCPQICDQYAKLDDRIKVIHKTNGGLSDARNAGMAVASGKYISFIDSDDYIDSNMLNILLDVAIKNNCQVVQCGTVKFNYGEDVNANKNNLAVKVYSTTDALFELINDRSLVQTVWNKLYSADVALTEFFPKGKLNEDEFWTYKIFAKSTKIAEINADMYFYLQRNSSIMGEQYSIKRLDALQAKTERQDFIQNNFPEIADAANKNLFFSCVYSCQRVLRDMDKKDRKQANKIILNIVKKYPVRSISYFNSKEKLWYVISKVSFLWMCRIRNLLKIGM